MSNPWDSNDYDGTDVGDDSGWSNTRVDNTDHGGDNSGGLDLSIGDYGLDLSDPDVLEYLRLEYPEYYTQQVEAGNIQRFELEDPNAGADTLSVPEATAWYSGLGQAAKDALKLAGITGGDTSTIARQIIGLGTDLRGLDTMFNGGKAFGNGPPSATEQYYKDKTALDRDKFGYEKEKDALGRSDALEAQGYKRQGQLNAGNLFSEMLRNSRGFKIPGQPEGTWNPGLGGVNPLNPNGESSQLNANNIASFMNTGTPQGVQDAIEYARRAGFQDDQIAEHLGFEGRGGNIWGGANDQTSRTDLARTWLQPGAVIGAPAGAMGGLGTQAATTPQFAAGSWGAMNAAYNQPVLKAQGGSIQGGLSAASKPQFFRGGTKGQADKVPAMLSDGEFVFDADTVAALGDGNTEAGAGALEQMRQNVRKHKRAAPANKIPPKAKQPEAYLPKGRK